jgi:glucuronate isomerase
MFPNIYIKRVKPSINKMKAADLKALGFKTKAIAKTFAKLSDVTAANYKTEHDFMEALKHKINNFKKLGLEFNNAFKNHDVSSPKVKANRAAKIEKKDKELLQKIDKIIEIKKKENLY